MFISKRDDFIVDASSILSQCKRFEYRFICSVLGVSITARAKKLTGDEIFAFWSSLSKESYYNLI